MAPRLKISGVKKRFGATHALRNISLTIQPGEVHALIGENGAGKSTLMKVLSGAHQPDEGTIELDGELFTPQDPLHSRRCGIAMIYQELNLAPDLSVEENILLGVEPARFGWIRRSERSRMARAALEKLEETSIPLKQLVSACSLAEKQMVEIARALLGNPKVLIMDEPTSSLTKLESEKLFKAIGKLPAHGVTIIYISHFLEECQMLADRYTVLRDGETVTSGDMKTARLSEIVKAMVGRDMKDIYPRTPHEIGEPILELKSLAGKKKPAGVSFKLRKGEIFGLAGLIGAGRTETVRTIFGLDRMESGEIWINQKPACGYSPHARLAQGVGLLSESRKEEGLMLNRSLADNLTITKLEPFSRFGFLSNSAQASATSKWIEKMGVKAAGPGQLISQLSGGNQQKIAVGRLLHHETEILLLDEPTRGIDVGSKAHIYSLIGELAAQGKAIIFVSSYLPELLGTCDTIGVMCRGKLVEARPVTNWTEHGIISAAIGQPCEAVGA